MRWSELFKKCISMPYITVENGASFAAERLGSALYLYFEQSRGTTDWRNNLDFPAKPYQRENDALWYAHRGFLRVWKSAEEQVAPELRDPCVRKLVIAGYSHGAALAVPCHEYAWYYRPDLRPRMAGYGFGCPRVVWGILPPKVKRRWARFTVVRNLGDPVTSLPPCLLGYTHVGRMLEIGARGRYEGVDAHRPENILKELQEYEAELRR